MSTPSSLRVAVVGAGAWGTALAIAAANRGRENDLSKADTPAIRVSLWGRNAQQVAQMQAQRENTRYLPGCALPSTLSLGCVGTDASVSEVARAADLVVLATPMSALRVHLQALVDARTPVAWLCKGFEAQAQGVGLLGHEVHAQVAPVDLPCGVLSGPSFAQEVARQQPTALVAASSSEALRQMLVDTFHSASLRVYASDDVVGVEVGGAVKNVLAIATGLCDGLNLGLNARAALITRGLAEMTRLGVALGARAETFMGLTGLGDLVLTATGDLSRNRRVGLLLAEGKSLEQAVASLGHVAEGVYSARTVLHRAQTLGVDMPITQAVVSLLDGTSKPADVVSTLMGRNPRAELDI